MSVGEVVEVGQNGGKRDVWSGTSGDLGWRVEERGKERKPREGGSDGGDERGNSRVW